MNIRLSPNVLPNVLVDNNLASELERDISLPHINFCGCFVFEDVKADPVSIFKENGGQLRMAEALEKGFSRKKLYSLRDQGVIEQISRGLYRLAELPEVGNPDLLAVALRYPNAVICLISALSFHGITTQIPHEISLAIPRDSHTPTMDYPPLDVHRFNVEAYKAGIEEDVTSSWTGKYARIASGTFCFG
ncbi:MAG: type IV toxin-antitoxin system AbiEi family antitoxin domain-containing protein, partial [Oceanipulchritudo sp.]